VLAAASVADGLLISTDGGLLFGDDVLGPSGLGVADTLTAPVTAMEVDDDDLWLASDGIWLLRDGWLHAVRVDGAGPVGAWTVHDGAVWLSDLEAVYEVRPVDGGWQVAGVHDVVATARGATADAVWALSGGTLLRWQGSWTAWSLPDHGTDLVARGRAAWVTVPGAAVRVAEDGTASSFALDGTVVAVDEAGRAWVTGETLRRVDAVRRVLVAGQGGALDAAVTLPLSLSDPDAVAEVTATVGGSEVTVLSDPWRIALDPGLLPEGPHDVVATATWDDGHTDTSPAVTVVAPGITVATWADHIEPLARTRCSVCHAGGTETVLDGPADWQARVADILTEVETARMPLGGDAFTASEIDLIRLWADGGFP
jgi:hypothetical protein